MTEFKASFAKRSRSQRLIGLGAGLAWLSMSGCFYQHSNDSNLLTEENAMQLRHGMNHKEVISVLGEPQPHRKAEYTIAGSNTVITVYLYTNEGMELVLLFETDFLTAARLDDNYIRLS
jgi:hypothetical protein